MGVTELEVDWDATRAFLLKPANPREAVIIKVMLADGVRARERLTRWMYGHSVYPEEHAPPPAAACEWCGELDAPVHTLEFPNLVASNRVVCNFYPEALFCTLCALLRSFAGLPLRSFAYICVLSHSFACFCIRLRLERPHLGTAAIHGGSLPALGSLTRLRCHTRGAWDGRRASFKEVFNFSLLAMGNSSASRTNYPRYRSIVDTCLASVEQLE